jgi:hypothetical protein
MNRSTQRRSTTAIGLLAAAGIVAFALVPQPREAAALPPGGNTQPQQAPLPAGHPPIDNQLPAGHPPIDSQLPAGHPPINNQLPAGHPPIDGQLPHGHPTLANRADATPPPPAQPADVESIESIVSAYYDSISAPAREARNWDRFRSLFLPEGRLIAAQVSQEGTPAAVLSPDQFVRLNAAYFEAGGYVEHDIFRRVETFGNTAHIFSTYETRRAADDPEPYSRGINSIQLVNDGARWWIATVMWDYERPGNPIPAHYLPDSLRAEQNP